MSIQLKRIIIENEVFNQIVPRIESEGKFENEVFNQIVPRKKSKRLSAESYTRWVGERCVVERNHTVRSGGRSTSENAGMSSENYVRIIMVENLRFLEEGSSAQGKSGAKARPKGVVDAHTVDIP